MFLCAYVVKKGESVDRAQVCATKV